MLKHLRIALLIVTISFSFLLSPACDFFNEGGDKDIEIAGEWLSEGKDWKQKLVVTSSDITNYWIEDPDINTDDWEIFWKARIYTYNNDIWNGDENGSGDCGYLVMKYTLASTYHEKSQGKYMVLRWQRLTSFGGTTMEWSEGFKFDDSSVDCGGYDCGIYFESILSAEQNATSSNGFFGMGYSSITKTN